MYQCSAQYKVKTMINISFYLQICSLAAVQKWSPYIYPLLWWW